MKVFWSETRDILFVERVYTTFITFFPPTIMSKVQGGFTISFIAVLFDDESFAFSGLNVSTVG